MASFLSELKTLGIPEDRATKYVGLLSEQGLERMADCAIVTDEELAECGVDNKEDRDKIRKGESLLKNTQGLKDDLTAAGIPADRAAQYAPALLEQGLEKILDLGLVTDAELKEIGVKILGDRAKIRGAVKNAQAGGGAGGGGNKSAGVGGSGAGAGAGGRGGPSASSAPMIPPKRQQSTSSAGFPASAPVMPKMVTAGSSAGIKREGEVYHIGGKRGGPEPAPQVKSQVNELEIIILKADNISKKSLEGVFVRGMLLDVAGKPIKPTLQKTFTVSKSNSPDFNSEASKHRDRTNVLHFMVDQNRKKISGVELVLEDKKGKLFGSVELSYQGILSASASNRPNWYDLTGKGAMGKLEFRLKYYAAGTREVDEETQQLMKNLGDVASVPPLNIIILIVGSRGDVQPFLSFALGLKARGHRVRISSHIKFLDFVRGQGVDYYPLRGDPETLMKFMSEHPDMVTTHAEDLAAQTNTLKEIFDSVYLACTTPTKRSGGTSYIPDVIISNPPVAVHTHTSEKLQIPLQIMFTMPWSTTKDYRHPFACFGPMKMIKGNRQSYAAIDKALWTGQAMLINKYRLNIGLPVMVNGFNMIERLKVPQTYCMSPHLAAKPSDWGPHIDVVGFWFLDLMSSFNPREKVPELVDFLEKGDKPFYIGFGSIVVEDPKKLSKLVIDAIEGARTPLGKPVRAIVHQGWAKLGEGLQTSENIFLLNAPVPHDWLFPLCSSCCHHGGAGTMAAGLRVGLPTIVVPFFGDQPFWGSVVAQKGVGPEPIFNTDINAKKLKDAIEFCYTPDVIAKAKELGVLLMEEDGVGAGVDAFLAKVPASGGKFMVEIWENQRKSSDKKKKEKKEIDVRAASKKELKEREKAGLGLDSEWKPCKRQLISKKEGISILQSAAGDFVTKDGLEDETVNAPNWSDRSMICKYNKEDFPLPFGWAWDGIWKVDVTEETDENGWIYSKQLKAYTGWTKENDKGQAHYRRRRHIRFRKRIPNSIALPGFPPNILSSDHPITIFVKLTDLTEVKIKTPLVMMVVHRKEEKVVDGKVEKIVNKGQHSRSKITENCKGSVSLNQTFYFQLLLSDEIEVRLLQFGIASDEIVGSVMIHAPDLVGAIGGSLDVDWTRGKPKCKSKLVVQPSYFETEEKW
eukprot:CAMPEP_0201480104 /NCGR_PEP_ID=MMETSP0151_2-20130828/4663_1 /ASSEMBLY_ACC=CAM_ASM_000257 /TAXON_ID=200890 /ORGANISM="Paramoeba atlantica, Strain 621/1 / CCAP 1560/9" /LENGTH=1139 /DNA_ID=CAMNT_0047861861 /DNA_START=81 /DNA_END=3500 /DNA_ORIENTATION=-